MTENTDWRNFATELTHLAGLQGEPDFYKHAFVFLNKFVKVDNCAVFKIATNKTTGAEHLCTFGDLRKETADTLAKNYAAKDFHNDPMIQTALISTRNRVRHIPRTNYSQDYRREYFENPGLVDKVSSLHTSNNVLYSMNFYRFEESGEFEISEFRDLERLAPIISHFVIRHLRLSDPRKVFSETALQEIVGALLDDSTQCFTCLSPKEREVCKKILYGLEEKDIAEEYGVSINTITTHRKRSYFKLGVTNKTELFQLALMAANY